MTGCTRTTEAAGEPSRVGAVPGDVGDLGGALPADQGRRRGDLAGGRRLRPLPRRRGAAAAADARPRAVAAGAAALAAAAAVHGAGDDRALAAAVLRRGHAVELADRAARGLGAVRRGA